MAQVTELSVLALPGMVHSFSAKAAAGLFIIIGEIISTPKLACLIEGAPKLTVDEISSEPKIIATIESRGE